MNVRRMLFTIGVVLGMLACWAMAEGGQPAGTWADHTGLCVGATEDAEYGGEGLIEYSQVLVVVDNRFNQNDFGGVMWWIDSTQVAEVDAVFDLSVGQYGFNLYADYTADATFRDQQVGDLLWTGCTMYDGDGHFYPKFFWFDTVTEDSGEATDGVVPAGCLWLSLATWDSWGVFEDLGNGYHATICVDSTDAGGALYWDTTVGVDTFTGGDTDWDGDVDLDDFVHFRAGFGVGTTWWDGDFDGDQDVDLDDFVILQQNFGN